MITDTLAPGKAAAIAAPREDLCRLIVESDRRYFEMGSTVIRLPGAEVVAMPGLAHCPSAVVVQRVSEAVIARDGAEWVRRVEGALDALGTPEVRIYCDVYEPDCALVLEAAGYEMRREVALVAQIELPAATVIELREVTSPADWRIKQQFHEEVHERPDGHLASGEDWVCLEQTKCGDEMRAFLAWRDGRPVGAIGVIPQAGPWRLKNIVVHSDCRRNAIGRGMIARVGELAHAAGAHQLCLFAVEGTPGEALYRACGFVDAGEQIEWSKRLAR